MVNLASTETDSKDAFIERNSVGEHRLRVVNRAIEGVIRTVRELGRRLPIDEVTSALYLSLIFDHDDEAVGDEDELRLTLSVGRRRLGPSLESVSLPLRTTILLPGTLKTNFA